MWMQRWSMSLPLDPLKISHPLLNFLSPLQIASDGNWRCSLNGEDENLTSFRKILQLGTETNWFSHFGVIHWIRTVCVFLFCAYFLGTQFAGWIQFHATHAGTILSWSLATITSRKHSSRLAGIAKIFSTRIMRTHSIQHQQRSQLCRSTIGSK